MGDVSNDRPNKNNLPCNLYNFSMSDRPDILALLEKKEMRNKERKVFGVIEIVVTHSPENSALEFYKIHN